MSGWARDWREWLAPVILGTTVVAFAAGSSSLPEVREVGGTVRWIALFALAAVAVAPLVARRGRGVPRPSLVLAAPLAALVALAFVSAAWSVDPPLTLARAASFAVLVVAAGGLALAWGDQWTRLLAAIVTAAAVVALVGLALLAVGCGAAAQAAGPQTPWRFRGFGENPNTASMLHALSLPLAALLTATAGTRGARTAAVATASLLYVSIAISQSRGALLAASLGLIVVAAVLVRPWLSKLSAVTLIAVAFVGSNVVRDLTSPSIVPPRAPVTAPPLTGGSGTPEGGGSGEAAESPFRQLRGEVPVRPQDELGHPLLTTTPVTSAGSGRVAAWLFALDIAVQRPLLGHGFGTEANVFDDRLYGFQGGNPENAYIGLVLQLGGAGLLVFAFFGLALLVLGAGALRRVDAAERALLAALLGAVVAGAALMLVQSYVYAVGNIATVSFWTVALMLASAAGTAHRGKEPLDGA